MGELKPCPFCGGEAKLYKLQQEHPYVYRVACLGDCKTAYGISFSHSEKYTAIAQWNRRAAPDALVEAATRLLHAYERVDEDAELALSLDKTLLDNLRAALRPVERGEEGAREEPPGLDTFSAGVRRAEDAAREGGEG